MFLKSLFKTITKTDKGSRPKKINGEQENIQCSNQNQDEGNLVETQMKTADIPQGSKNRGKLFVGGLHQSTTSKTLETYFSQFGKVLDAFVMRFPESGKSRGFGFVTFFDPADAAAVLKASPLVLDGKTIDLRPFTSRESASKTTKNKYAFRVFLGGLPPDVSADTLKQFFERYGEVEEVIIPMGKTTKKPKGFGFVCFKSEDGVQKCLGEKFLYIGGRRTVIKKAEPRNHSQARGSPEVGVECDEYFEKKIGLGITDEKSSSSVTDNETASVVSGAAIEEDFEVHKLFEEFFALKLEDLNKMNEAKSEGQNSKMMEIEKLLTEFLVNSSKGRSSDEYSTNGSDDFEFDGLSSSVDEDSTDSDSDSDDICPAIYGENKQDVSDELSSKIKRLLTINNQLLDGPVVSGSKDCGGEDGDFQVSAPFNFRDGNGSVFCSLCQWTPQVNSCESFLAHCKTPSHKTKLKERFTKEPPGVKFQKSVPEIQNKIQPQNSLGESKKQVKVSNNVKKAVANTVKKESVVLQNVPKTSKQEIKQNETQKVKEIQNLKAVALAKGMSCICPLSNDELQCKMCNKRIPKAVDFSVLIKNVTAHLQSRNHLKKLLETEHSLLTSLEENQKKTKTAQKKVLVKEKKCSEEKNGSKKNKKQKVLKKTPQSMYLCVLCNFLCKNIEKFKAHLKSESHSNCFTSKGETVTLSVENLSECQSCGTFLYGPLYYINRHYNACVNTKE